MQNSVKISLGSIKKYMETHKWPWDCMEGSEKVPVPEFVVLAKCDYSTTVRYVAPAKISFYDPGKLFEVWMKLPN